jgi:hypothetical protein
MDLIFQILTVLGALLTLVMTGWMVISFRKERPIGVLPTLISVIVSLILLPVFMLLSGVRLIFWLSLPLLAQGLLLGGLQGFTTRMYHRSDGQVMGKRSWLFLFMWGGSLALAQVLNLFDSALLASLGLVPMCLTTGTQVGADTTILLRRLRMRSSGSA